jgi:SHS2 domain-containing protein
MHERQLRLWSVQHMDLRDVKVLPQRKRNGPASPLNFDTGQGFNSACSSSSTPHLPAPASFLVASSSPVADDSAAVRGLSADALGIYHCDASRRQFEFLDHTADIQIHSWGDSFAQAAEQAVVGMFNYISDTGTVDVDASWNRQVCAVGHDLQSLLYNFMNDWLFEFCGNEFMPFAVRIVECDLEGFRITSVGVGERFDRDKHVLGTEVKAITYSAMQINQRACGSYDIYVIVDI